MVSRTKQLVRPGVTEFIAAKDGLLMQIIEKAFGVYSRSILNDKDKVTGPRAYADNGLAKCYEPKVIFLLTGNQARSVNLVPQFGEVPDSTALFTTINNVLAA